MVAPVLETTPSDLQLSGKGALFDLETTSLSSQESSEASSKWLNPIGTRQFGDVSPPPSVIVEMATIHSLNRQIYPTHMKTTCIIHVNATVAI